MSEKCSVTKGEHDWAEGNGVDWGRYSCARCHQCLHPETLIESERKLRAEVAKLRKAARGKGTDT